MTDEAKIQELEARIAALEAVIEGMRSQITLRSLDGTKVVTIAATDENAGIWVKDGDGKTVAMYVADGVGPYLGGLGRDLEPGEMALPDFGLTYNPECGGTLVLEGERDYGAGALSAADCPHRRHPVAIPR